MRCSISNPFISIRLQLLVVSTICVLLIICSLKLDFSRRSEEKLSLTYPVAGKGGNISEDSNAIGWDPKRIDARYLRSSLRIQESETEPQPNRILLGIFSMDTPKDKNRRRLTRKTYLSAYAALADLGMDEGKINRICSLRDIQMDPIGNQDCRMIYTFVVGGLDSKNATYPTEQIRDGFPFIIDSSEASDESDITYLAIRENMNEGKSLTWFKYATTIAKPIGVDIIGKIDSDTVLFPLGFQREFAEALAEQQIRRPAQKLYGGLREVGDEAYMQGGFYLLSTDFAEYIVSDKCPRQKIMEREVNSLGYRAEDREIGWFVNSFPVPSEIRNVFLPSYYTANHHWRNKEASHFRVSWKDAFAKDVATIRLQGLKASGNSACKLSADELQAQEGWFEEHSLKRAAYQFQKLVEQECLTTSR